VTVLQAAVGCVREGAAAARGGRHQRRRRLDGSARQRRRDRAGAYPPLSGLQATGFVLKPDRTIAVAQYSSGPIGRLVWQDVLGLVQFYKKQTD